MALVSTVLLNIGGFITEHPHSSAGWCKMVPFEYFPPVRVVESSLNFGCLVTNDKIRQILTFQKEITLRKHIVQTRGKKLHCSYGHVMKLIESGRGCGKLKASYFF